MKKVILFVSILTIAFFALASPIFAFTVKGGKTVNLAENMTDDVYISGQTINVTGEIDGDLIAAGGKLVFKGSTTKR